MTKKTTEFSKILTDKSPALPESALLPPIVTAHDKPDEVQALKGYFDLLMQHGVSDVARAEASRLQDAGYFNALGEYVGKAQDPKENKDQKRDFSKPAVLSDVFSGVADVTSNVILSQVAIIPNNLRQTLDLSDVGQRGLNVAYDIADHRMAFGFLQMHHARDRHSIGGSITLPLVVLSNEMLSCIERVKPRAMLEAFQKAFSIVNHDSLHHYHNLFVGNSIAETKISAYTMSLDSMRNWRKSVGLLEEWSLSSHSQVLTQQEDDMMLSDLGSAVRTYFTELKRISKEVAVRDRVNVAEVTDYYSGIMLDTLARLLPLDHPLMNLAVQGAAQADGSPETLEKRFCDALYKVYMFGEEGALDEYDDKPKMLRDVSRIIDIERNSVIKTIDMYESAGLSLISKKGESFTQKQVWLLRAIMSSKGGNTVHLAPGGQGNDSKRRNETANLIRSASETVQNHLVS